jgi:hypothetical protein
MTQEIVDRFKAPAFHLLRDAYVQLHGFDVDWYRATEEWDRRTAYGTLKRDLVFDIDVLRVALVIGRQQLDLLDTYPQEVTEQYDGAITGFVKYGSKIRAGDCIGFALDHFNPLSKDRKVLQCIRTTIQGSRFPIGRMAFFVPVRNSVIGA